MPAIRSLTSDIKPDNWATFYLFYFNQGLGSDACFQLGNHLIYIFIGNLMSAENNGKILEALDKKHNLAAGEFMHILEQLMINDDLNEIKSSVGAALFMEKESGIAKSVFFGNNEEIKGFVTKCHSTKQCVQIH